jgi:hypothetical protein
VTRHPAPDFRHLLRMTDRRATFEHAEFAEPRPAHGYCTDDMARVLVVATREREPTPAVRRLAELSLRFLSDAQGFDGDYRNRMNRSGRFVDRPTLDDCWGRSIWGLGTAAARSDVGWVRQSAMVQFERAARRRSPSPRATWFAVLGATEVLMVDANHREARALVIDAADTLTAADAGVAHDATWRWPEPRLAYANAALPDAMIAAGEALDRPELRHRGLELLAWLLDLQTADGHLSVTPAGGLALGDARPGYDQQPIEVAALADACARAARVDDHERWTAGVAAAVAWFVGDNDQGAAMWDEQTGGGFDGLEPAGVNRNQGAESTLALLSTLQHARGLVPLASGSATR